MKILLQQQEAQKVCDGLLEKIRSCVEGKEVLFSTAEGVCWRLVLQPQVYLVKDTRESWATKPLARVSALSSYLETTEATAYALEYLLAHERRVGLVGEVKRLSKELNVIVARGLPLVDGYHLRQTKFVSEHWRMRKKKAKLLSRIWLVEGTITCSEGEK